MTLQTTDDGPSRVAAAPKGLAADWAKRPVGELTPDANALTVDVEDYFQVEAFAGVVDRERWGEQECRIERNVDRILEMFANAGVHGTFFTLGWIATRYPSTIRKIVAGGHELASHGLSHHRADAQSRVEFLRDVAAAKKILEDTGGVTVKGYRAASFSIAGGNLWAFDALEEAGYRYSSSLYPIRHDSYGMPEAPRFAFYPFASREFMEIPVTTARRFGANWPCGGGGYFRLLPYWLSVQNMRSVKQRDGKPCVFYFHPWEIDPGQPRVPGARLKSRLRHYTNIDRMQARLERLLKDFQWKRLDEIYPVTASRA
jgi:polysaccharide deacetylase family protein (PEP-CTERM system associated)